MQIPFNTPLGFIGFLMLGLGVFLLLAGFNILNVEKVTVKPGKGTWVIGAVFSLIGVMLVFVGDQGKSTGSANNPVPIPTPIPTSIATTPAESPPATAAPTTSQFAAKYDLLAEAGKWPLSESESFDESDPDWLGFGTYQDESVKHNQRIENGKLIWGLEPILPNIWYWQASPYYSYRDFYLSFKFKRDLTVENFTYYGLFFRKQGGKFYAFRIDENQRFAVQFLDNGNWTDLIGWTKSEEIDPGKFNELTVIAEGPNMTFYINRIYVGDAINDASNNGEVGFTVGINESGPEVQFEFDDFELREKP